MASASSTTNLSSFPDPASADGRAPLVPFAGRPRVGVGAWAIGGPFWSSETALGYAGADDASSRAALRAS
jgi:hypothetical protein